MRNGPRPTSGRTSTTTSISMPGRFSFIIFPTPGSISPAYAITSCARKTATISKTAAAPRMFSANMHGAIRTNSQAMAEDCWGITASDGPGFTTMQIDGRERRFLGYAARGVPYGPDDGTISPCAALASLPFAPELALSALRHFCARYPEMINGIAIAERLQSDSVGRRPVRLGLRGLFRTRPGHRRPDDRKLSVRPDLEADAAMPLYRQRTAPRRLLGRLVVMTNSPAQQEHRMQCDQTPQDGPPDDCFRRALVDNVHPSAWRNPKFAGRYNLVVIGAGPGGVTAAREAAALGAKVALIERDLIGGDRLNVGCVPSKAIIRTARLYAEMRRRGRLRRAGAGQHRHRLSKGDGADAADPGAPQPGHLGDSD